MAFWHGDDLHYALNHTSPITTDKVGTMQAMCINMIRDAGAFADSSFNMIWMEAHLMGVHAVPATARARSDDEALLEAAAWPAARCSSRPRGLSRVYCY